MVAVPGGTGTGTSPSQAAQLASQIQLSTNLSLVNRTLGRIITSLQDIDNLHRCDR